VIYLGFNETWRLRRKYGELYYRQFWGQMIHRLGLSHALGSQKDFTRFTIRRLTSLCTDLTSALQRAADTLCARHAMKIPSSLLRPTLVARRSLVVRRHVRL